MVDLSRRTVLQSTASLATACGGLLGLKGPARAQATSSRHIPVLAHRGACALRPEHTLASYAKAIADGADYIEPDLMPSKDGVLVATHDGELSGGTDIASRPEFADRKRDLNILGRTLTGWFVSDLTFTELKTLRRKETMPKVRQANSAYDGEFQMVSFEEMIDFVAAESVTRGRLIGLVPELKFSTYFASIGLPLEDRFLDILSRHSYLQRAPLIIQSFEIANLKYLRAKLGRNERLQLMQLINDLDQKPIDVMMAGGNMTFADMTSAEGLKEIARYADIISPDIRTLIPLDAKGYLGQPHPMIGLAHAAGLKVQGYEFRPENQFIAANFRNTEGDNARNVEGSIKEMHHYLRNGLDGFFTDDPGIGRQAVDSFLAGPRAS
ncbi:glycerophosphodiester phosphodiesterase family protein [Asticcacaulis benevestitus]|uniref:glycerophosphodiester phosphodiesterase family protein n=1 Tax=Asticcacaulis benevestitus TaxID=347481 RepID=UPI0003A32BCB|nr:glycerophosphodiester phosphodiesterase family protein [Asticcacaulis benevestitus]